MCNSSVLCFMNFFCRAHVNTMNELDQPARALIDEGKSRSWARRSLD